MCIHLSKEYLIAIFSVIIPVTFAFGQNEGTIWYFGDQAGLDFNTSTPTPLLDGQTYFPNCCSWNECTSSVCDSSGTLLFYTNGEIIWNSQQQVMENGSGLMGHASSTASSLIIPQPGNDRYYYVFTTDALENNFSNGLRYTVVDQCLNNNLGAVLPAEKNIELYDNVAEKLAAVLHSDEDKYWIISHGLNSDAFCAFLLTSQGIQDTIISNTGPTDTQGWGGQMVISPDGQKIAYAIPNIQPGVGKAVLFDFDTSSGIVSNEQILSSGGREYGASFSPDNSKLYFSTIGTGSLFQYDITLNNTGDIIASKSTILEGQMDTWRDHRLGPDGKIYISRAGQQYLSIIENPNEPYPDCNYLDAGISLGDRFASFGLPNFIAGYEYVNKSKDCIATSAFTTTADSELSVYPNPFTTHAMISFPVNLQGASIELYNIQGQFMKQIGVVSGSSLTISRDDLSAGIYVLVVHDTERTMYSQIVISE